MRFFLGFFPRVPPLLLCLFTICLFTFSAFSLERTERRAPNIDLEEFRQHLVSFRESFSYALAWNAYHTRQFAEKPSQEPSLKNLTPSQKNLMHGVDRLCMGLSQNFLILHRVLSEEVAHAQREESALRKDNLQLKEELANLRQELAAQRKRSHQETQKALRAAARARASARKRKHRLTAMERKIKEVDGWQKEVCNKLLLLFADTQEPEIPPSE